MCTLKFKEIEKLFCVKTKKQKHTIDLNIKVNFKKKKKDGKAIIYQIFNWFIIRSRFFLKKSWKRLWNHTVGWILQYFVRRWFYSNILFYNPQTKVPTQNKSLKKERE